MSLKVFYEILNQRDTPAMFADVFSNRPAFGFNGRIFISTDTKEIYRDYGTFWDLIADAGAGSGTLQSVCTNGNTTTTDITIVSPSRLFIGALSNGGVLFPGGGSGQVSQSANLFWDNTNNRLGINTNTPTATFDIHSTSSVMMQLNQQGLNNSLQSFLLQGVGKWRIGNFYNAGDNDFYIYDVLSGTPRAYFTNTGYTIFPTNLIIGSSNRSSAYGMDVYVSANLQSTLRVVGGSTFLSQINGTFAVFTGDLTVDTNTLFVDSTNNRVGIGTITPSTTLDVIGAATFSSSVTTLASTTNGFIAQTTANSVYPYFRWVANNRSYWAAAIDNGSDATWQLGNGNTVGSSPLMTVVASSGNVGIGTNTIVGLLSLKAENTNTPTIVFQPTGSQAPSAISNFLGANQTFTVIGSNAYVNSAGSITRFNASYAGCYIAFDEGEIGFGVGTSGGNPSQKMRITSGGTVGINSSGNASYQLLVKGNNASVDTNGQNTIFLAATTTVAYIDTSFIGGGSYVPLAFATGGGEKMRISTGGVVTITNLGSGTVTATSGVLSAVSDMNLKIEDGYINNALEKVLKLKPRYYHWKEESGLPTNLRQLGFYAQEVNEALGEETANTPKNENDKWGIYDRGMIAFLTAAIQEQQIQIEELKLLINK